MIGRRALTILVVLLLLAVGGVIALTMRGPSTTILQPINTGLPPATTNPVPTTTAPPTTTTTAASPTDTSSSVSSTESATTADTPSDTGQSPSDSMSIGDLPGGSVYLGAPIDGGDDYNQDVQISGKDYPNSSTFGCGSGTSTGALSNWNAAGYSTFTAMVGIPDNASYSTGSIITVYFYDQNRQSLGQAVVSLGHPQAVDLKLKGAVRLQMDCTSKDDLSNDAPELAFGNGALNP